MTSARKHRIYLLSDGWRGLPKSSRTKIPCLVSLTVSHIRLSLSLSLSLSLFHTLICPTCCCCCCCEGCLVACKSDLAEHAAIRAEEAQSWAQEKRLAYFQCSA